MSKTKIVTSAVSMGKAQHSIVPATTMETPEGPIEVRPRHISSSTLTIEIIMVTGGEFDESKREALLMEINRKLAILEI